MTTIFNDPAEFTADQLTGFLDLYRDRVTGVPGGVIAHRSGRPQVAVVIGGGSGHYPAFAGTVGPGLATGAVVGNIFTSPSAAQAYSVARAADQGRGVVFSFGNYAGDNMNFGIAAERLCADGVDTRIVVVTDDIASAEQETRRRGIAGDFVVFKVMGAAAAEGRDLNEVERLGRAANAATRSLGVAFSGCTMPGQNNPLFRVPDGHLGLGLGIHGEPGISDVPMPRAEELAELLSERVLAAAPPGAGHRVTPILNGLGTTKYEELFLLWAGVARRLRAAGYELVDPEVGELVTSLDMGGCSLTLMWLDEELERLWRADAYTPAYRKLAEPLGVLREPTTEELGQAVAAEATAPPASLAAQELASRVRTAAGAAGRRITQAEVELGRIDAVAGDGDHGRGMVKGITAALGAIETAPPGAGGSWLLQQAGRAWADQAGGTSGVLWGAALESAGRELRDDAEEYSRDDAVNAVRSFAETIGQLGRARLGDKTMLDALLPFLDTFRQRLDSGSDIPRSWSDAAETASTAAEATSSLRPQVGRARPLAERSIGTPDAGATSVAMVLIAVGGTLSEGPAHV